MEAFLTLRPQKSPIFFSLPVDLIRRKKIAVVVDGSRMQIVFLSVVDDHRFLAVRSKESVVSAVRSRLLPPINALVPRSLDRPLQITT